VWYAHGSFQQAMYWSAVQTADKPFPYPYQIFDVPLTCAYAAELIEAGYARWAVDEDWTIGMPES